MLRLLGKAVSLNTKIISAHGRYIREDYENTDC